MVPPMRPHTFRALMRGRRFQVSLAMLLALLLLAGCATGPRGPRIDNIPMYGQPEIKRPDFLKKADEEFIQQVATKFPDRKKASTIWWLQGEKYMSEGNLDYAMRRYNQSWLLDPENYQPYWGFARVAVVRDKWDDSIKFLTKAEALCKDPYQKAALLSDFGAAYSIRASALPASQTKDRARYFALANTKFIESTKLDPKYEGSWYFWAQSLYREERFADAWEKLKKSRALGQKNTEVFASKLAERMPEPK